MANQERGWRRELVQRVRDTKNDDEWSQREISPWWFAGAFKMHHGPVRHDVPANRVRQGRDLGAALHVRFGQRCDEDTTQCFFCDARLLICGGVASLGRGSSLGAMSLLPKQSILNVNAGWVDLVTLEDCRDCTTSGTGPSAHGRISGITKGRQVGLRLNCRCDPQPAR
jgi:hypothetical protein